MYIDNLLQALVAFDDTLDRLAKDGKVNVTTTVYEPHCNDDKSEEKCKCGCKCDDDEPSDIYDDIKQVIFNDPVTIVTFKDGSKVSVKAERGDKFSKEMGVVYAIVKRLYANDIDRKGYMRSKNIVDKLEKVLNTKSIDQKEIAARKAKAIAEKKAKKSSQK